VQILRDGPRLQLVVEALSRPGGQIEVFERLRNKATKWLDGRSKPSQIRELPPADQLRMALDLFLGQSTSTLLDDPSISRLENHLARERARMAERPMPFGSFHNGSITLGRLCYAACRCLKPKRVVETGVAYGVTSAYILQAMADNDRGELDSIDLPPLARNGENWVGHFVPDEIRRRWRLYIGSARKLLPDVLRNAAPDVFIHDSLHTYAHMKWEIELVLPRLRAGGVLIADDIQGNRAFDEALASPLCQRWFAIRQAEKNAICGAIRVK
jgi:predicted O-methyltransferase YrrM